jgi:hypothetical protein
MDGSLASLNSHCGGCLAVAGSYGSSRTRLGVGSCQLTHRKNVLLHRSPQTRSLGEFQIDCEEDRTLRAVSVGMLREG